MSDHTKGDWVASVMAVDAEVGNGAATTISVELPNGRYLVIAEVWKTSDRIPSMHEDVMGLANARLMAASPKLLFALERALSYIPRDGDQERDDRELAEHAIFKATGRRPE